VPSGQRTVPDARDEPFTGDMANSLAGVEGVRADGAVDLAGGRLGAVEVVLDAEVLELVQGILGGGGQLVELQQQHDQAMVAGDVPPLGLVQQRQRVGEGRLDVADVAAQLSAGNLRLVEVVGQRLERLGHQPARRGDAHLHPAPAGCQQQKGWCSVTKTQRGLTLLDTVATRRWHQSMKCP